MPVNFPCTKCKKACKAKVTEGEESIHCDSCKNWVHYNCTNLTRQELETFESTDKIFICDRCFNTCKNCKKLCKKNQKSISCEYCKYVFHERCCEGNYGRIFKDNETELIQFWCPTCLSQAPPE